uniref:Signal peptidase I n=1 Tax=uncultured bacterium contig00060 TaxID=1181543 RepID=A0A806KJ61_9BACT|nr:signal peptidase I [uncultured bacterium contig00060]
MAVLANKGYQVIAVMFDKWTQYSYRAQKYQRSRLIRFVFIFFILFVIYNFLTAFFFSVWVVDNNTMQPGLSSGDRLIFTSFTLPSWLNRNANEENFPFKRGSIVLVDMGRNKEQKLPLRIIDSFVRFFTAQKVSIFSARGQYYIKRVIALPGDEISMTNYMFKVKTANNQFSLTEFELSEKPYHPAIPQTPALWDETIPFSGSMETIILGPNECFVVSDDRGNTNDSRTWGAIPYSLITARAVVRIWPLVNIERL